MKSQRCVGQYDGFYAQDRGRARDETKREVSDGRMIVRERRTRRKERTEHERTRYARVRASCGRIQCTVLFEGSIAARSTREEFTMDVVGGPMGFEIAGGSVGAMQIGSLADSL